MQILEQSQKSCKDVWFLVQGEDGKPLMDIPKTILYTNHIAKAEVLYQSLQGWIGKGNQLKLVIFHSQLHKADK